jgi:hypothetical protein
MNGLHRDIIALEHKIDGLYAIVEQLSRQVAELLARAQNDPHREPEPNSAKVNSPAAKPPHRDPPTPQQLHWQAVMSHKDVLMDDSDWEQVQAIDTEPEPPMSNDLQVRRLTAQVTAAYNRIAALEEQLLSHRSHSSA